MEYQINKRIGIIAGWTVSLLPEDVELIRTDMVAVADFYSRLQINPDGSAQLKFSLLEGNRFRDFQDFAGENFGMSKIVGRTAQGHDIMEDL